MPVRLQQMLWDGFVEEVIDDFELGTFYAGTRPEEILFASD